MNKELEIKKNEFDYKFNKDIFIVYTQYRERYKELDDYYIYESHDNKLYKDRLIDIIIKYKLNIYELINRIIISKINFNYYKDNISIIYANIKWQNIIKLKNVDEWRLFNINYWDINRIFYFNWIDKNKNSWLFDSDFYYWTPESEVVNIDDKYYFIN